MNKNLFKTFAIAAMAVLAGACAKEQVDSGDGETVEMTFNVDVPGVEVSTKGLSDAASVNELICQVFLNDGNYTPVPDLNQTVEVKNKKAKVTFNLVKGQKYAFIFWAQTKGTGYYNTEDLRSVKMNVAAVKANDPTMDAFWATETKTARIKQSLTKVLYRALAQVNFGQVGLDRQDKLTIKESLVKAKGVPDTFHPFLGATRNACEGSVDITFAKNTAITDEKLTVSNVDYDYLATAYVFAPNYKPILSDVSATFIFENGNETTVSAPNAPLQGKYRTNVLGNLLTVDLEWNVRVDPQWGGDDVTYDAVRANLEAGKEVTLSEDYSVADKSKGVTLDVGVTSVLNLNGKKFSNENGLKDNKAALQVHGDLTINGDGEVYCEGGADNNAIIVEQGGHLVINGGTYDVGAKSNATIFVMGPDKYGRNGSVEINGGVFMAEAGSGFVLNQHDDITVNCFSVKGGTFVGFNPASVNEAKGAITSFVAEGYHSTKVSTDPATGISTYVVTKEGVTPVVDQAGLDEAMANLTSEPVTISLPAGNFSTYGKDATKGKTLTFNGAGAENTNFIVGKNLGVSGEGNSDYSLEKADVTFNDLTITTGDGLSYNYRGFVRAKSLTFVNCTIKERLSYWGGVVKLINCKFEPNTCKDDHGNILPDYNITTYQGTEFSFENCSFKSAGKFMNLYKEQNVPYVVRVKDCTFIATKIDKPVLNMKSYTDVEYKIYFEGTNIAKTEAGVEFPLYGGETASNAEVYVNNTLVWSKGQAF